MFNPVYANCPLCIITVGGGLLIAKKLGLDNLLVSIWISGLNSALAFWIAGFTKSKHFKNGYFLSLVFYLFAILYLQLSRQFNDRVLAGLTLGLIVFWLAVISDKALRIKNSGRIFFYYQKVIVPLVYLLITTMVAAYVAK